MMTGDDWRHARLPDGRAVEFVDAVIVEQLRGELVVDVTVLINGATIGKQRVTVPIPAGGDRG
jgi:hypothetical protein